MKIRHQHFNCLTCTLETCSLKCLDPEQLDSLKHHSVSVQVKANEFLFQQHAPVTHIMHVKEGLIKVYFESSRSAVSILNLVSRGTFLGLRNTLLNGVFEYSAQALVDTEVCYLDPVLFKSCLQTNSALCMEILSRMSRESLQQDRRLQTFMESMLPGKLARSLLFFSDEVYQKDQFDLPLSKTEFAQFIGASRERVSRILNELHRENTIAMERRSIRILNKQQLIHLSKIG